jgi:hypothetical protein
MIFHMENAIESEYPEIRSAASRALHSGKILGFEIERPGIINEEEKRKNLERFFGKIDKLK